MENPIVFSYLTAKRVELYLKLNGFCLIKHVEQNWSEIWYGGHKICFSKRSHADCDDINKWYLSFIYESMDRISDVMYKNAELIPMVIPECLKKSSITFL